MREGRRRAVKTIRFLAGLAAVSSLLSGFGCAPKAVRIYEPEPAVKARGDIVRYAMTLLGKPYRNAAKGPDAFDCSGFVHYVYGRFDVSVPVSTEGLNRTGYEIERNKVEVGDLVVFRIKRDYHVGIMINEVEFIHASKSRGVTIDNVDASYWKRNLRNFRRVL